MKEFPHHWTKRGQTDDRDFDAFVAHIREHGYLAAWFPPRKRLAARRCNVYLELDGWRYWTMGWRVDETIIINREQLPGAELFSPWTAEPISDAERGYSLAAIRAAFE